MYQEEEMRVSSEPLKCPHCRTTFPTKTILKHHTGICNFIHTSAYEHSIDRYYNPLELPNQESMVHYMIHLTTKYQELEQKFAKLQSSIITTRRKSIQEYLEQLAPPSQTFAEWTSSLEITLPALETVFQNDLKSGIQQVLDVPLTNLPIRAFSQKPNIFYLYDTESEWRQMSADEFVKFVNKIERKFQRKYEEWSQEHREQNRASEKAQNEAMSRMAKVHGFSERPRAPFIKKWLYTQLAVSIKQYVV
jgi:hypothetical protein